MENGVPLVLSLLFLDTRKKVSLVILAPVVQRTVGAMRPDRPANKLAKSYEYLVERKPIFSIRQPSKLLLSILWRLRLNDSDPVEDPMNMSIDGNCRCLEPVDEDTVGSLASDRWEFQQLIHALRHFATMLVDQDSGDLLDSPGFRIVETHRFNESGDSHGVCSGEALDIWEPGEEPGGSESCYRILGSMR